MGLGTYRQEDLCKLQIARVILPQRGGKQLRLKVGRKDILVELSVKDERELGEVRAGDWVEVTLHSLVEQAARGKPERFIVESGWANGRVEGRVDELAGGRWSGIIFDMGNGLKSYVDKEIGAEFEEETLGEGGWWHLEFSLPHQCMIIRRSAGD